jgi:hypothetical protein
MADDERDRACPACHGLTRIDGCQNLWHIEIRPELSALRQANPAIGHTVSDAAFAEAMQMEPVAAWWVPVEQVTIADEERDRLYAEAKCARDSADDWKNLADAVGKEVVALRARLAEVEAERDELRERAARVEPVHTAALAFAVADMVGVMDTDAVTDAMVASYNGLLGGLHDAVREYLGFSAEEIAIVEEPEEGDGG